MLRQTLIALLLVVSRSVAVQTSDQISPKPLVVTPQDPVAVRDVAPGAALADFGRDGFARPWLDIEASSQCTVVFRLGEKLLDGRVDTNPPGSVRFAEYELQLAPGRRIYRPGLRRDPRNTMSLGKPGDDPPILMPEEIGEVYPFRYVEVLIPEGSGVSLKAVGRDMVHYPFDDEASYFHCSDSVLNAVWDLCKYSVKATSFCGIYVDGDRERIPYEADALINQMCHYGVDAEYGMARATLELLTDHATWPTEWLLQMPQIAWNDYIHTGDASFLERRYDDLVAKALIPLRDSLDLISTKGGVSSDIAKAVHFNGLGGPIRDIVDWPHKGGFGSMGEDDYYEYTAHNTVVNAYHAKALDCLSKIAQTIGRKEDSQRFAEMSEATRKALRKLCFDEAAGVYRDGVESSHSALHANVFPLAFGLVDKGDIPSVVDFIKSRGLVCSVYAAHFLLEALYEAGAGDYALSLMSSTDERSWYNMIREGSTITMEAWGQKYKPNQDWNHAWGAAPASAIPHGLMGVTLLAPGGSRIRFRPQPGGLDSAEAVVPTPRGGVACSFERLPDGRYRYEITVPKGVRASVELPGRGKPLSRGAGRHIFVR